MASRLRRSADRHPAEAAVVQKLKKSPQNFLATELDGELILVHGRSGAFYSIKDSGLEIWRALDATDDLDDVVDSLCETFDVEKDQCRKEVRAFSHDLVEAGFAQFH